MKRTACIVIVLATVWSVGCSRSSTANYLMPKATAYGAAIVESSGGKQSAEVGTPLPQPVVVQVNDEQGNAVTGALVVLRGPNGIYLDPAAGLTDSSGQFTSNISLGTVPGRYQLTASTTTKAGKTVDLKLEAATPQSPVSMYPPIPADRPSILSSKLMALVRPTSQIKVSTILGICAKTLLGILGVKKFVVYPRKTATAAARIWPTSFPV